MTTDPMSAGPSTAPATAAPLTSEQHDMDTSSAPAGDAPTGGFPSPPVGQNALSLFDVEPTRGRSRSTDPATSHAAAALDRTRLLDEVRRIYEGCPGGMTDWEAASTLYADPVLAATKKPSVGKRRQELGCVARLDGDGEPMTRGHKAPDGRVTQCIVWVLPPALHSEEAA